MGQKIFVILILLTFSSSSYACKRQGLYAKHGYYGQFFNTLNALDVKGDKNNTIDNVEIRNQTIQNMGYQPANEYQPSYIPTFASDIAFGYMKQSVHSGYKFELEGIYSLVRAHNINLYNGPLVLLYSDSDNAKSYGGDSQYYGAIISNNRIENISIITNFYYFWKTQNFSFSPYIGLGIGGTRIKVYEKSSIKPAYQIKVGLNYCITKDTDLYIGYKHFGVIGSHGNFEVYYRPTDNSTSGSNVLIPRLKQKADNHITLSHSFFSTHGIEMGISIHLN